MFNMNCALYDWLCQNQKIINIFNEQLGNIRVIILGWSTSIRAYIFDKNDYETNVLKLKNIVFEYQGNMDIKYFDGLNWKHLIDYGYAYKYERDEDIIYDLIQFSKTGISKIGNLQNNDVYKKKRQIEYVYLKVDYKNKDKNKNNA